MLVTVAVNTAQTHSRVATTAVRTIVIEARVNDSLVTHIHDRDEHRVARTAISTDTTVGAAAESGVQRNLRGAVRTNQAHSENLVDDLHLVTTLQPSSQVSLRRHQSITTVDRHRSSKQLPFVLTSVVFSQAHLRSLRIREIEDRIHISLAGDRRRVRLLVEHHSDHVTVADALLAAAVRRVAAHNHRSTVRKPCACKHARRRRHRR